LGDCEGLFLLILPVTARQTVNGHFVLYESGYLVRCHGKAQLAAINWILVPSVAREAIRIFVDQKQCADHGPLETSLVMVFSVNCGILMYELPQSGTNGTNMAVSFRMHVSKKPDPQHVKSSTSQLNSATIALKSCGWDCVMVTGCTWKYAVILLLLVSLLLWRQKGHLAYKN